jgi:hypothetical protein
MTTERPMFPPSRRALLMGLAAVATPIAPAIASAMGWLPATPVSAPEVDPIFAVIEQHRTACDGARVVSDALSEADENYDAVKEQFEEAIKPERELLAALLIYQPTTLAGVLAVLEYVGAADWIHGDDSTETILIDAHERGIEEAKMFPSHLAAALRNIVERGQA